MLPIKKVVLFKHGIGHFEREGQISGDASMDLYFRAAEMNDVLKSLTVLDLDGGLITSISYESTLPVEEQLKDIAIELPEKEALTGLLAQLQGAHIAVDIGSETVTGTVTGIQTVKRHVSKTIVENTYVSLLVNSDSLQIFDLLEVKQITLLDDTVKKDLQHLLSVLIATKKKDLKKLTVFLKGKGERTLNISYIVEAPVWKTSYRLLLNENSPLIQGWALVDNTQDEDWENVSLSLVAGLPVSFVHDLYSPRYQPRSVVQVKEETAYAPPQSEPAVETYLADDMSLDLDEESDPVMGAAPITNFFGLSTTPVEERIRKLTLKKAAMEHSVPVQTRTVEVGDLFQYDIQNPVTVRRQQSALVPILQASFTAKRVAVYNPEVRPKNPMSAVLFNNTTGLTLEGGPITIFENDAYVGEAMLNTLKPGEEQLVPFSVELGCIISIDPRSDKQDVHQVQIRRGSMHLYHYELGFKNYIINNKTERDLDLFLEHRFKPWWELTDTPEPVERTEHFYRFRLSVPSKKTTPFTVTESIERKSSYSLQDTSRDILKLWVDKKYVDKKTQRILEGIANLTEQRSQIQRDIESREQDIKAIFQNQERLRQNLKALGNTQDERSLRERYLNSLTKEEDKLAEYQEEIQSLKDQKNTCEKNLQTQMNGIEWNAKL